MANQKVSFHHVVIIGAGFGGLNAAKSLGRRSSNDNGIKVTVIDRRNHHLFQPLLYQVATAGLSPAEIATPIRSLLSKYKNVDVVMANVTDLDLKNKKIIGDMGEIHYDSLVLACGAKHSYFGHNEFEENAPGLKTLEQATEIRRRVLLAYELAERETDSKVQKQHLTFVVVGGGPTGVELAGALGEISRYTLSKDFHKIDPRRTRVVLIEAGPRILAQFDEDLSQVATRDLERLGVTVWTSTRVTNITSSGVEMGSETLHSSTVIWAAGVQPSSLNKSLNSELDKIGRVKVNQDLSLPNYPDVYVLGDQASFEDIKLGVLPGLAPVAMQQGRYVGRAIVEKLEGRAPRAFRYADKGQMATIGRKRAVVQVNKLKFSGILAWFTWLFVHIYYLIGFKNRIFVFYQWAWSYFTLTRGARLILWKEWRSTPKEN